MKIILAIRAALWCLVPIYLVFFMPGQIGRVFHTEMQSTRTLISDQGDKTRALVSVQLTGMRQDLTSRTDSALQRVDAVIRTINTTEADANSQIAGARKDIEDIGKMADVRMAAITDVADSQLSGIRSDLKPTLDHTASITSQADEALPYILDCDPSFAGQDCAPNKYLEISHEGEAALKAVTNATPQMVIAANGIAADVHAVADDGKKAADKFVSPPTRWEKFRAIVTGALVVLVKAGL